VTILDQVACGLAEVHQAGQAEGASIAHRKLNLSKIMWNEVKAVIIGFGRCKEIRDGDNPTIVEDSFIEYSSPMVLLG